MHDSASFQAAPHAATDDAFARGDVELSVVTTAHNEQGNVEAFLTAALAGLDALRLTGEVIYIDDGSRDATSAMVERFAAAHPQARIRLVRHPARRGITAAINEAARLSRGTFICFLPADLESHPEDDIPALYRALEDDTDVVLGWREGRQDGKQLASNLYNFLNKWFFGLSAKDANWIKLVRREKMEGLNLRVDWHRFLVPILFQRGCKFTEVKTKWWPRTYGKSNFGSRRLVSSVVDIISVKALLRFGTKPLAFFLYTATIMVCGGVLLLLAGLLLASPHSAFWVGGWVMFGVLLASALFWTAVGMAIEFLGSPVFDERMAPR